jgi:hypothetical protein
VRVIRKKFLMNGFPAKALFRFQTKLLDHACSLHNFNVWFGPVEERFSRMVES